MISILETFKRIATTEEIVKDSDFGIGQKITTFSLERYSELIIKQCAIIANHSTQYSMMDNGDEVGNKILESFEINNDKY